MAGVIRKTTDGVTAGVAENPEIVHVRMPCQRYLHDASIALHQFKKLSEVAISPKLSYGFAVAAARRSVRVDPGRYVHHQNHLLSQSFGFIQLPTEPLHL